MGGIRFLFCAAALLFAGTPGQAANCVVPSDRNGGFQLTCDLAQQALALLDPPVPLEISYLPGGVGALAYAAFTSSRRAEPDTLVAFSEGTLFNLSQGTYGGHDISEVRWLVALGLDHGAITVREDAPWKGLAEFMTALADNPGQIAIGGSGTTRGRDWMRAARTAEQAGASVRQMRFVAFDGAGACVEALRDGHVAACMTDASLAQIRIDKGDKLRILAVYAAERLPGALSDAPTAREQGVPIDWPVVRGVYMGPDVSDADYQRWVTAFDTVMRTPEYTRLREEHYLLPLSLTGEALTDFVVEQVRRIAAETALP